MVINMSRLSDPQIKSKITDAAMKLFLHYGYAKTTVEDIATKAGIGKGSVYLHYKNKQQILTELMSSMAQQKVSQLRDNLRQTSDPVTRLRLSLFTRPLNVWDFYHQSPHAHEIMPIIIDRNLQRKCQFSPVEIFEEVLLDTLTFGIEKGAFTIDDPGATVRHISVLCGAFLPPYRFIQSRDELLLHLEQFFTTTLAQLQRNPQ